MRGDKLNILLVEDNEDHAYLFKRALNGPLKELLDISVVTDGEEAIQYVKRSEHSGNGHRPDLIFLDIKLPKKDGFEVLRALKEDQAHRQIPIILFTSSDRQNDIAMGYTLGANSYISKPLSASSLVKKVRRAVLYWLHVSNVPPRGER